MLVIIQAYAFALQILCCECVFSNLSQSQVAERPEPWGWAAVQHGGRGLYILGQIPCENDTQCFYLFVFLMPMPSQWIFCPLTVMCLCLCSLQQNFKWEEQNYVVQNEINNLSFLTNNDKTFKVGHIYNLISWLYVCWCASLYKIYVEITEELQLPLSVKKKNPVFIWSQYSAWPWEEEAEEEEGLLFHQHLSDCGFNEEADPCGTQGLFSKRSQSHHLG